LLFCVLHWRHLPAQKLVHYATPPNAHRGEIVYKQGCIACHGADGKGADPASTVFVRPHTFPDFTRCDQTTPEPDSSYKAVVLHGGHGLGFSQIMPAFGDVLTNQQIDDVIAYLRSFCNNVRHYPAGELNLPRALVTEKAFPEDELVLSTAADAGSPASWTTDIIHEQTFAGMNQIEIDVPINYAVNPQNSPNNNEWTSGFGDITLGVKRVLFSSLPGGSILSAQVGFLLPTGDSKRNFGAGTTTFEPFLAYDQLLGERNFLQFQLGGDVTFDSTKSPRRLFFNAAAGRSMAPDHGLGRLFTPMVEFTGTHDYGSSNTDLNIVPEMQVTVSKRQHIRAAAGVNTPVTNTADRKPQITFYVLWDWAEGAFWNGWR
jgi:hypothetical protein